MYSVGDDVRLAHAFRSVPSAADTSDLAEVLSILNGAQSLMPRPPADSDTVKRAESLLGLSSPPIYTFAGCLHPKLGTIGLIIKPECWRRCMQGASRCDTGGLAGRRGSFKYLSEDAAAEAIAKLACANHGWSDTFSVELSGSYTSVREYVAGSLPKYQTWNDARAHCIDSHLKEGLPEPPDRRLWTWEVRLAAAPIAEEYESLLLSDVAFKKLEELRRTGQSIPGYVKIVRGHAGPEGVHHFHEDATIDALCGGSTP